MISEKQKLRLVPQDPFRELGAELDRFQGRKLVEEGAARREYKECFRELKNFTSRVMETTMKELVEQPYRSLIGDYLEKSQVEREVFEERVS